MNRLERINKVIESYGNKDFSEEQKAFLVGFIERYEAESKQVSGRNFDLSHRADKPKEARSRPEVAKQAISELKLKLNMR